MQLDRMVIVTDISLKICKRLHVDNISSVKKILFSSTEFFANQAMKADFRGQQHDEIVPSLSNQYTRIIMRDGYMVILGNRFQKQQSTVCLITM